MEARRSLNACHSMQCLEMTPLPAQNMETGQNYQNVRVSAMIRQNNHGSVESLF